MLPRGSPERVTEGVDKIYDVSQGSRCKGFIELRRMGPRPSEKVDPEFRVYIDPLKKYDYEKSATGLIEMSRQTERSSKYLIQNSSYIEGPARQPSASPPRLPGLKFDQQLDRPYYYRQKDVRDCYYAPNHEFVRQGLGRVGMPFAKQTVRKGIVLPRNCHSDWECFDYDTHKHLIYPRR
jgi:hypothetical protein